LPFLRATHFIAVFQIDLAVDSTLCDSILLCKNFQLAEFFHSDYPPDRGERMIADNRINSNYLLIDDDLLGKR
jgi:hypothetical protein